VSVQHETTDSQVLSHKSLLTQNRNRNRLCTQCNRKILNLDAIFGKEQKSAATAAAPAVKPEGAAVVTEAAVAHAPRATDVLFAASGASGVSPCGSTPSVQHSH
jgi:hypothetical protein